MQSSRNLFPVFLPASVFPSFSQEKKKENTHRELQNIFPFFNYSGWGQYVLMMSWFSECILQLCQPEQWCLLHMSGRGLVVIWGSLQLVRPRAGTEHNFSLQRWITFLPLGSPLPHSVFFLLVSAASLFVFDLSLFPALFSPPSPLNRNILYPPSTYTPSASLFISWSLFLALCRSLSASLHSFSTLLGGELAECSWFGVSG